MIHMLPVAFSIFFDRVDRANGNDSQLSTPDLETVMTHFPVANLTQIIAFFKSWVCRDILISLVFPGEKIDGRR